MNALHHYQTKPKEQKSTHTGLDDAFKYSAYLSVLFEAYLWRRRWAQ